MSVKFPLIPIRLNVQNAWQCLEITETITVPLDNDHIVRLTEVPDNGDLKTPPMIPGLSRTVVYPPNPYQYYVNFRTGDVQFNGNQAGMSYDIVYWGKGSLIEVDDINYLYDTLSHHLSGHITINDTGTSNKDVWSAEQIINYFKTHSEIFQTDVFPLTAQEATSRYVMLSENPKNYQNVVVMVGNGVLGNFNEDYVIDPLNHKFLRWDGFGFEGILQENDVLYVMYAK